MADSFTPTLNLTKPEVGASTNSWGTKINAALDLLDTEIAARRAAATANAANANSRVARSGDTMTGTLFAPSHAVDPQLYLALSGGTAVLNLDSGGDAIHYVRSSNTLAFLTANANRFSLDTANIVANLPLTLNVGATAAGHATRKDYVDSLHNAAQANANNRLPYSGGVLTGDLSIARSGAAHTGALFLGNSGQRYLFWDGANYTMPGGNLFVGNNNAVWHNANLASPARTDAANTFSQSQQIFTASNPCLDLHFSGVGIWRTQVNNANILCWTDQNNAIKAYLDPSGNMVAGNFVISSDATIKNDIRPITGALAKVKALRGVTFERADLYDDGRRMGFIAQEVEPLVPEVVRTTGNTGLLGVAYQEMVALLNEAVKELAAKVEALEAAQVPAGEPPAEEPV